MSGIMVCYNFYLYGIELKIFVMMSSAGAMKLNAVGDFIASTHNILMNIQGYLSSTL